MENEKVVLSVRIEKELADQLEVKAQAYTIPGEPINISIAIREAIRQFVTPDNVEPYVKS